MTWKFAELAQYSESQGSGSLKARFEVEDLCPISTIVTQFNCEGTTLSGVEFELASGGYRVSLIKRRFVAGKKLTLINFSYLQLLLSSMLLNYITLSLIYTIVKIKNSLTIKKLSDS